MGNHASVGGTSRTTVDGDVTVVGGFPSDFPDLTVHNDLVTVKDDLQTAIDRLESILGEVGDIDTLAAEQLTALQSALTALQGTLTVAGTVAVSNFPATQPVSGSVSVSNFPATQPISATTLPLPAGAATSGKQDTGNGSLASIDGKITAVNTGAVVVSSSALPTDAATSTAQSVGNASVASIDTKTPGLGQALAGASVPVVLPTAQIATLTPLAQPTDFPSTAANTKLDTLHTDLGHLTDKTQTTQLTDGTNAVSGATGDSSSTALAASAGIVKTTAISSATVSVDCAQLRYVAFQLIGSTFNVTPQVCDDNFTWTQASYESRASSGILIVAIANAPDHYVVYSNARYFRLLYNSGTVTGNIIQSSVPFEHRSTYAVQSGTWTVAAVTQGSGAATQNGWAVGGGPSALSNNAATTAATGSSITYLNTETYWGMQVVIGGTGSFSAINIVLEGSLDGGTNFFTIATYTTAGSGYIANTSPTPATIVRARIVTATVSSGTPTITTRIAGAL